MCNENLEQETVSNLETVEKVEVAEVEEVNPIREEKLFKISLLRSYATIISEAADLAISQFENQPEYENILKKFGNILLWSDSEIPELLSELKVD